MRQWVEAYERRAEFCHQNGPRKEIGTLGCLALGQSCREGGEVGEARRRRKVGACAEGLGVIKKQKRLAVSERVVVCVWHQRAWGGLTSGEATEAWDWAEWGGTGGGWQLPWVRGCVVGIPRLREKSRGGVLVPKWLAGGQGGKAP